jgi:hypothetical protein
MSSWFCKNVGDAMMAFEPLSEIEDQYRSMYPLAACSKEVAVFVRHNSEGHLHCEVEVYFSPASVALAKKLDADPCARPSPYGLSLLIGSKDSWSALFPEGGT